MVVLRKTLHAVTQCIGENPAAVCVGVVGAGENCFTVRF